ncbi:MAG: T9SS type A sorting domain-containing protein [Flavobacteriaceae bacterium]
MKTIISFLALFLSAFTFSQEYIPMLQEGNSWSIRAYDALGNQTYYSTLGISGTEVINNQTYYYLNTNVDCRFREENGVMYGYSISDDSEIMLYDFNLEVGDEITFFDEYPPNYCASYGDCGCYNEPLVVSSKSEEFIADEDRIVMELSMYGKVVETWIEGIGSLSGFYPFWGFTFWEISHKLTCFSTNDITYYFNNFNVCIGIVSTEDFIISGIKLYPNPVTQTSVLKFPEEAKIDLLKIYDVSGRLILEESVIENYYTIEASKYHSGLYFYQVFSDGERLKSDTFIVK